MIQVEVVGMAVPAPGEAPLMLLREPAGSRRWLAIMIGYGEAEELVRAREHIVQARPGPIELLGDLLAAFGQGLSAVEVTEIRDGIFYADLVLASGARVSARPSDAVALGLRQGAPITVAEEVLDVASVQLQVEPEPGEESGIEAVDPDDEVARFRAELDNANPEDFGEPPSS
jgi:bifunctional DNase/RNase